MAVIEWLCLSYPQTYKIAIQTFESEVALNLSESIWIPDKAELSVGVYARINHSVPLQNNLKN